MALDLARITGWSWGHGHWNAPWFGTWHTPIHATDGERFARFENELIDALDLYEPEALILEAPIAIPAMTNRAAVYQQLGLRGMAYAQGWRRSIAVSEVSAEIVRLDILGYARINGHPGAIKTHVLHWARKRMGWKVPDHNAADACMIWEWRRRKLTGPHQGQLLAHRVHAA